MKKIALLIMFGIQANAQNTFPVGTLKITNDGVYNSTINSGDVARIYMGYDGTKGYINFGAHTGGGQRENLLYIRGSDGNVGIGTSNPLAKFQVDSGNILVRNYANITNQSAIMIAHSINISGYDTFGTSIRTITQSADYNIYGMQFFTQESYLTGQTEKLRILGNGNVGIGTSNPTSKLTVAGNIASREVKVTVDAGADFVFEKDYNLPSIDSVEKFIKENKHLPEIASAQEMQKDGINLSEMNIKLLQKIEELTLYMIEMKKENNEMRQKNEEIKKENDIIKRNQIDLLYQLKNITK